MAEIFEQDTKMLMFIVYKGLNTQTFHIHCLAASSLNHMISHTSLNIVTTTGHLHMKIIRPTNLVPVVVSCERAQERQ